MNDQELSRALERYVESSSRRDSLDTYTRLSQLEPSIIKYLESRFTITNSNEIHKVEKILIRLDERIKRLENPQAFEETIGSIVLKKIVSIAAIMGVIVALIALFITIFKL